MAGETKCVGSPGYKCGAPNAAQCPPGQHMELPGMKKQKCVPNKPVLLQDDWAKPLIKCPAGTYLYKGACINVSTPIQDNPNARIDWQQVMDLAARWRRLAMGWAASAVVSALATLFLGGWVLRVWTILTLATAIITLLWWAQGGAA